MSKLRKYQEKGFLYAKLKEITFLLKKKIDKIVKVEKFYDLSKFAIFFKYLLFNKTKVTF